jgi:hypothetical protein
MAQQLTHLIEARPDAPEGVIESITFDDMMRRLGDGDAVICRKNAPLVALAYDLMKARIPFRLLGKDAGSAVATTLRGAGRPDAVESIERLQAKLERMREAHAKKKEEEDEKTTRLSEHLEVLICVTENYVLRCDRNPTTEEVASEISTLFAEQGRGVTLSSIHRAKGGEWPRVFWMEPDNCTAPARAPESRHHEMLCVRFVATTRSMSELYLVSA